MNSTKKAARIAGTLYLVNAVTGFFSIIYVPSKLIVAHNAAATANNILGSEKLFRVGIVLELICAAEFILVVWALWRLLGRVNKAWAWLMVVLGLVTVPVMLVNALNEIGALSLFHGADFLSVFDKQQLDAAAMLFLDLHSAGFLIAWNFGLWFFPLGLLVYRSGFLPRVLGFLLFAGGCGYMAQCLTFFFPITHANLVNQIASVPVAIGEPSFILWLLIRGAKDRPLERLS